MKKGYESSDALMIQGSWFMIREKSFWAKEIIFFYNEEFDPGSGWTLATGLTHASRGAARWSSNTDMAATGARVRNRCAICP